SGGSMPTNNSVLLVQFTTAGAGGGAGGLPPLNTVADADPALADSAVGWDASAAANGEFLLERILALAAPIPGGRLTLTSGQPIVGTGTARATLYYTPYLHNGIVLWDGTRWVWRQFARLSLPVPPLTAQTVHDVFCYLSAGVPTLERLAWSSTGTSSTRATGISLQDGRYCKVGDKTRLYLGTFYADTI